MATVYADIKGITFLRESIGGAATGVALITFTMAAYTASTDNGQIGGGGTDRGATTSSSLQTILQNQRRDGKTVTLQNATNGVAMVAEPGKHGATTFWVGTFVISTGNITFNVTDTSGSEINAASGITDRPISLLVAYALS